MLLCRVRRYCKGIRLCSISQKYSQSAAQNSLLHPEILTLLHKTDSLIPRVLPPAAQTKTSTQSSEFWHEFLSKTRDETSSKSNTEINITIYGTDKHSGAADLVTALLEDPLTSDTSLNERLRTRWKKYSGQASISLSSLPSSTASVNNLASSFLHQTPVPLRIVELRPVAAFQSSDTFQPPLLDEWTSNQLLSADIAVIVCNPLTTPLSALHREPLLFRNPNTILVITFSPTTSNSISLKHLALPFSSKDSPKQPYVLFVDPLRAVAANEALASGFQSPSTVQRYQDNYAGSRVSSVIDTLKHIIPEGTASLLPSRISLSRIRAALSTCQSSLDRTRSELEAVHSDIDVLKKTIEETKQRILEVLNGSSSQSILKPHLDSALVADAIRTSGKEVKTTMDRLTWWKMVWRVDEISNIISQTVQQAWCRDLEQRLILHTGRLSVIQESMTKSTFTLLDTHSSSPFNSAVLRNELRQLTASPAFSIVPDTLTLPINLRRTQIIEHPTTRLHVAGQRALLGMSTSITTGVSVSWAGWLGWLAGTGDGLLGAVGLDPGTAVGVGLLGAVAGVRWSVEKWERSKRRWWEDWNRVGEGLGRDLKATLDETMHDKVLVVAESGCTKLTELAVQRQREIEEVQETLDDLFVNLDLLEQRLI